MERLRKKSNPVLQDRWYKTFLGQRQQHTYWLYKVIDDIVTSNPQIERFVELGTGTGALSVILGCHAVQKGSFLLTYDLRGELHAPLEPVFKALNIEFNETDYFEDVVRILRFMDGRPTFFFCDGGNKKDEFNTFADLLYSGSVIAAHDYTAEVMPDELQKPVDRLNLEPLQQEDWVGGKDEILTCFYRKP